MTATTMTPPPSLSDRLAEARQAAQEPRKNLADTEAALRVAEDRRDYDEAKRLSGELPAAREAAMIAEATVRALAEAEQALSDQVAAEQRTAEQADRQAEAQQLLGDAMAAEKTALSAIDEHLSQFWTLVSAARDAFRAAQGSESAALAARHQMIQARVLAGDYPAPGPTPVRPNLASVLLDQEQLVRLLVDWRR